MAVTDFTWRANFASCFIILRLTTRVLRFGVLYSFVLCTHSYVKDYQFKTILNGSSLQHCVVHPVVVYGQIWRVAANLLGGWGRSTRGVNPPLGLTQGSSTPHGKKIQHVTKYHIAGNVTCVWRNRNVCQGFVLQVRRRGKLKGSGCLEVKVR